MDDNKDFQGQGHKGNDQQNYVNKDQQNLKENLELESSNKLVEEFVPQNTHEQSKTVDSVQVAQKQTNQLGNESVENNCDLTSNKDLVLLGNQKTIDLDTVTTSVKTKPLENIEQGQIVHRMDDDNIICDMSGSHETNSNILVESSFEQHGDIHVNPEVPQKNVPLNDNENKNSIHHTVDSSIDLNIIDADTLPAMLVKEVNKLNISPEEKKSKGIRSKVVVTRQTESLKSLMSYNGDSDSDEHSDTELQAEVCDLSSDDEENNTNTKKTWRKNTVHASGSSDPDSDSSASTLSLESDSDEDNSDGDSASVIDDAVRVNINSVINKESDKGAVKRKNPNILDMEEFLPPLPDLSKLNINFDESDFMHIGRISATIGELITVTANPGTPAFDLDSMLFVDGDTAKKPIGLIYDVLGPVAEPIYCVRFNSETEIKDMGLMTGMKVYTIPKNEKFTKYVFIQELMKIKGSDASWFHDQETPSELAEYSDDEKERYAKRSKKTSMKRKLNDASLERHKKYERTMNHCNTLNTRVCSMLDIQKNHSNAKHIRPSAVNDIKTLPCYPELPPIPPALFDPSIPPPGFGQPTPYSITTQPLQFDASHNFGQSATFGNSPAPFNSTGVPDSLYGAPVMFGHHYLNETAAPHSFLQPPALWSWKDLRRPQRSNNPRSNQQNLDNYFTNHSRNFRGAGPSSHFD